MSTRCASSASTSLTAAATACQLSREDEAAPAGQDAEVRREDQDKINAFSRLHQRETRLETELHTKQVL